VEYKKKLEGHTRKVGHVSS